LVPAEPGYPGNGKRRYPVKEILMKRKLNLALWVAAAILAVVFLVASSTKLFVPKQKLAGMGGAASRWVEDFSPGALKAIGAPEFLAAVGLIVPAALGIAVCWRGDHAPAPWREGNDHRGPGLSRHGRLRGVGPLRPRVLHPADPAGLFSRARLRPMAREGLPDRGRLVPDRAPRR
jgi:DoxX-like protein